MSAHRRAPVRPRYGRIGVASASVTVTAIAVLGGAGALPSAADEPARDSGMVLSARDDGTSTARDRTAEPRPERREASGSETTARTGRETALPADSGTGRRVVFSEELQRVWLVGARDAVLRTYLVSGSLSDNLDPGTYSVYSRSEQAWGIDDSGTMRWFVRFAQGDRAAIGFHDIPVDDGAKVQTVAELGTPQSHGCIRQRTADAKALWDFAPLGTTVVVV